MLSLELTHQVYSMAKTMEKNSSLQINFSTQIGKRNQIWKEWENIHDLPRKGLCLEPGTNGNSSSQSFVWTFVGFPGGSDDKEYTCHNGDPSSVPE